MHPLKMRRSRKALIATLPKRVLQKLNFRKENSILLPENLSSVQTDTDDPDFEAAMQAFTETRKNYRNALRELAQ